MKSARRFALALVTAPSVTVARRLARALLRERLIACANLVPGLESHYWWQGRMERGSEVLLILKTTRARLVALEKRVLELHPYETPEFLVLSILSGNEPYLRWLTESTSSPRSKTARRSPLTAK